MKISRKTLLAHAKNAGYAGDEGDCDAIKSFVSEHVEFTDASGKVIDQSNLEVIEDAPKVRKSIKLAADAQPSQDGGDTSKTTSVRLDDVSAIVADAVTKAVGSAIKRPGLSDTPVSVRTVEEALYESEMNMGKTAFKSFEKASAWRDSFLANVIGNSPLPSHQNHPNVQAARKRLADRGVTKAYATSPNAAGGALVPTEFYADLIRNVSEYGAIRRLAKVVPMSEGSQIHPVMTGRHTLSYPTEGAAITQSNGVTYSNVQLNAKDGSIIVKVSRRLVQDAALSFMDEAFREIARAVAYTEDYCGFVANGEAAFGNMTGIVQRFLTLGVTAAASRVAGGGNWAAHTQPNLSQLIGTVPDYARARAVFTCTPEATQIFHRLAMGQGGVTYAETIGGGYVMKYFGHPIIENNVMNATADTGTTTIDIMFGDFSRAILLGDRMGLEIDVSEQRYWDENSIGIRGVVRHDINVHDVGSTTARGPVAYLYQT